MNRTNLVMAAAIVAALGSRAPAAAAEEGGHVIVAIDDLRNGAGFVRCVLFNQADGWPEVHTKALRAISAPIEGRRATCDFSNVPAGNYAFAYVHDENSNKKLDKNLFGVPIEGYGVSNNARGTVSAPSFASASFRFDGGTLRHHPKTKY